jgi:hypothetical protein
MDDGTSRLVVPANVGDAPLIIKRGGEYWGKFVQDQKVYKTVGNEGVYEILKLDVEGLADLFPVADGESGFMAPGTYQMNLFVKLLDPHALYEFGYPLYKNFGRHILIGFDVVSSDTAATVAAKIYESLEMAVRKEEFTLGALEEGAEVLSEFEAGESTVIGMRAKHYALRFDSLGIAVYDETTCDSCVGEYLDTVSILDRAEDAETPATIAVEGVEPFATGMWLIENLRFPTYPNIRWAAVGEENRPIPGVKYVQYSFAYDSPRPQFGGLSGVGQKVEAVTRHVYYVPEALMTEFEAGFAGIGVEVVETSGVEITNPDTPAVSGGDGGQP